jgi:hypothetical protein
MTLTTHDLLTRLLDVTPAAIPDAGPDLVPDTRVEALLATFEAIIGQRAAIIAQIAPPITLSEIDRPLLVELERRQNIWQDALAVALRKIGEQRMGITQLRAYAVR